MTGFPGYDLPFPSPPLPSLWQTTRDAYLYLTIIVVNATPLKQLHKLTLKIMPIYSLSK